MPGVCMLRLCSLAWRLNPARCTRPQDIKAIFNSMDKDQSENLDFLEFKELAHRAVLCNTIVDYIPLSVRSCVVHTRNITQRWNRYHRHMCNHTAPTISAC